VLFSVNTRRVVVILYLTLEDGNDMSSHNIGKKLPLFAV